MNNVERKTIIEKIIDYFKENEETFIECIEELDGYNGYLNDDRIYNIEELNEFYHDTEPIELLYRVFYGHDNETWTTDEHGEKQYGEFNPNRNYFFYNGYGNLVSCDYKDYSDKLDSYLIEQLEENRENIYSINDDSDLSELFDELEQTEEWINDSGLFDKMG